MRPRAADRRLPSSVFWARERAPRRKKKPRYPVVKKAVTRKKKEKKADERGLGGFPHERLVQEEAA